MRPVLDPGVSNVHANAMKALAVLEEEPQCMSRVRTLHEQLTGVITTLNERVGEALASQESEFLRAYRAHMFAVQRELSTLRAKADDATLALAKNDRILGLERERDWYRGEAVRLDSACEGLKGEIEVLREKVAAMSEDSAWMEGQLREYVRNEKRYLKQIAELQKKLKQTGLSATAQFASPMDSDGAISFRSTGFRPGSNTLKDSYSNRSKVSSRPSLGIPKAKGVALSTSTPQSQENFAPSARFSIEETKYEKYESYDVNSRGQSANTSIGRPIVSASSISSQRETTLRFSDSSSQTTSALASSRVSSANSSIAFMLKSKQQEQSLARKTILNEAQEQQADESIFGDDDLGGLEGQLGGGLRGDLLDMDNAEADAQNFEIDAS